MASKGSGPRRPRKLGTHIIAEFYGCDELNNAKHVMDSLKQSAKACGATVLNSNFHKFRPQGVTGYVLLSESHISIHTWPEYRFAAVDVFTCGRMKPSKAVDYLEKAFKASRVKTRTFDRG